MLRNVSDPDLRLLRIFACVVKCGGFTAAQAELNMSQSNISMHIASLEKRLGYRLRARQGRLPTDRQGSPGAGGFANDVRRHRPVSRPGAGVVRTFGRGAVPGPGGQSRDLAPGPFRRCAGALPAARPGCPTEPFRQFAHRAGTGGDRRRAGPGDFLFQPFAAEPRIPPAVSRRDRRVLWRSPSAVRRGAADPGADRRL